MTPSPRNRRATVTVFTPPPLARPLAIPLIRRGFPSQIISFIRFCRRDDRWTDPTSPPFFNLKKTISIVAGEPERPAPNYAQPRVRFPSNQEKQPNERRHRNADGKIYARNAAIRVLDEFSHGSASQFQYLPTKAVISASEGFSSSSASCIP